MTKQPIIITGCPRSGAGIIAGILRLCGAYGGRDLINNTNQRLQEEVISPYLTSQNADPGGQFPILQTSQLNIPFDWKQRVENQALKGFTGNIWYVKSSQAALMWPVWNASFPDARWVIVRRRTADVVDSCIKTAYMDKFKDPDNQKAVETDNERDAWLWMVHRYEEKFYEMIMAGLDCKVIWPQRMVFGDFVQIHELLNWTNLKWRSDVLGYVDKKLEKSRIKETW